jgi:SPP1 gp7 family putative phage head morphogenesis protein
MSVPTDTALPLDTYEMLVREAREAAEHLLEHYFGLTIEKALDLHTRAGFDAAVVRLAVELRRESGQADADALRLALRVLDVDWHRTSAEQRRELVATAMAEAGRVVAAVPKRVEVIFGRKADQIVGATRRDARGRQRLSIAADFNALDRRIISHAARSQALFVTDEYGRRQDEAGKRARDIVARGLEQGLGRDDITADLEAELGEVLVGRSRAYWDIVASSFTASTRSYGQMSSYAEAGIERYRISAVLDEATTDTCRFLDGKVFGVAAALRRFEEVESLADPAAIKSAVPWVREGRSEVSGRRRLYVVRGAEGHSLAEVVRSGSGHRDDRGIFADAAAESTLDGLGIGFPPFHGHCRTTTTILP